MKKLFLSFAALYALHCTPMVDAQNIKTKTVKVEKLEEKAWDPKKTSVFIVCLARFEGEGDGNTSFSTNDRNDTTFVELLQKQGVPKQNIVFLMDKDATLSRIKSSFQEFLDKSASDETLLFYFGSHGGYDPETREHTFSTFESTISMQWAIDSIEERFKGKRAILFSDSCYSGGLTERASKKKSKIAYSVLSSTSAQQVAWSQWRFIDSLIKGFSGDPLVDLNADGAVTFSELSIYTEERMAFVAEGKPTALTAEPGLIIAKVTSTRVAPRGGQYVEAKHKETWYKAEVLETKGEESYIHYTDYDASWDEWVKPDRLREYQFDTFKIGQVVEAYSNETWSKATVLKREKSLHLVRWEGLSESYDEWVGPGRIRSLQK
jgi:hypothetical protein